jgi:hypothetical protein
MPLHHARRPMSPTSQKTASKAPAKPSAGQPAATGPSFPPDVLLTTDLPRDHFPVAGGPPHAIHQAIAEELLLDGNSKQNLATFCQTWEAPEVHALMDLAIDKNLIDKDEYPQTAEIESRCVSMLADLWHAPGAAMGCSTVGGRSGRQRASRPTSPT